MRESRGKRRSHASARNAAGSWYANSSARTQWLVVSYYAVLQNISRDGLCRALPLEWNYPVRQRGSCPPPQLPTHFTVLALSLEVCWLLYWSRNSLHLGNMGVQ